MRIELRPTTADDLPAVVDGPLLYSIRAITALAGETVLGVGGLAFIPDCIPIAFVQASPEAQKYPRAFHRAGLKAMEMIRQSKVPAVVASTDTENPVTVRWLERLGFRRARDANGKTYFVWKREFDAVPSI